MLRRRRVCFVAFCLALLGGTADSEAFQRDEALFIRPEDQHTTLFGSLDAGRSYFLSGGSKQTLNGSLDRPGFVLVETSGVGLTRERSRDTWPSVSIDRFKHDGAVMLGYQWMQGPVYAAAYLGPELYQEQVAYGGRFQNFSKPLGGLRGQVDLWANPIPEILVTGTLIAGTAQMSVYSRASTGVRIAPNLYVGPEVTYYATPTYNEARFGAHLTGLTVGIVQFRLSVGWMTDAAHRSGVPYGGLSAWMRL